MNTHLFRKKDLCLITAILAVALLSYILLRVLYSGTGCEVNISVDGETVAVYPLDDDREITLTGYRGGTCVMRISDGHVTMVSAECPDKICVHHHAISHDGESIICLPNRIVIRVTGAADTGSPALDGISQ